VENQRSQYSRYGSETDKAIAAMISPAISSIRISFVLTNHRPEGARCLHGPRCTLLDIMLSLSRKMRIIVASSRISEGVSGLHWSNRKPALSATVRRDLVCRAPLSNRFGAFSPLRVPTHQRRLPTCRVLAGSPVLPAPLRSDSRLQFQSPRSHETPRPSPEPLLRWILEWIVPRYNPQVERALKYRNEVGCSAIYGVLRYSQRPTLSRMNYTFVLVAFYLRFFCGAICKSPLMRFWFTMIPLQLVANLFWSDSTLTPRASLIDQVFQEVCSV
jgi:hypothetical protein